MSLLTSANLQSMKATSSASNQWVQTGPTTWVPEYGSEVVAGSSGSIPVTFLQPGQTAAPTTTTISLNTTPTAQYVNGVLTEIPGARATLPTTTITDQNGNSTLYSVGTVSSLPLGSSINDATYALTGGSTGGSTLTSLTPGDPSTNPANSTAPINPVTSSTAGDLLANLISSLAGGQNQGAANSGYGVGTSDTSLPPPSAADVAALQPTAATTTSSGPNVLIVVAVVAVIGLGIYLYIRHRRKEAHND